MMPEDRNCLSWWFPRVAAEGLPVPRTTILRMPPAAQESIWAGFDGREGTPDQLGALERFFADIRAAAEDFGYPVFLRTGHTSGKHEWSRTCCLSRPEDVPRQVFALAEYSECAGFPGLPWAVWAVREFLPVVPLGTCPRYGSMPVVREFRCFVDGGRLLCWHPYWPRDAIARGGADPGLFPRLAEIGEDLPTIRDLACRAGAACGGAWSVDLLATRRGWFVTDMAEAAKSFHWPGCPAFPPQTGGRHARD